MAYLHPVDIYGLKVPVGEGSVPGVALNAYPCTFRLTMAAIDPTAAAKENSEAGIRPGFVGSTLKMIRIRSDRDDEDDEDYDMDMAKLLNDEDSDEEDDSDLDEDINGGPSDPEKSPAKARRKAALEQIKNDILNGMDVDDEDDDKDEDDNGKVSLKAKGKAKAIDDEDDDSEDDSDESVEPEEFVLCTLDLNMSYQQPLDIIISDHETVYFSATGTHNIYLTGNILLPEDLTTNGMYESDDDEDDDEIEYDLSPDEDELELPDDEDESDALDDMSDPRIEELDDDESDSENIPKLVNGSSKPTNKNKNKKRAAEDSDDENVEVGMSLDELISQTKGGDGEQNLSKSQSKKQRKKVKSNEGNAVEVSSTTIANDKGVSEKVEVTKSTAGKPDKKVQFAKTLVQGPTSSSSPSPGVSALKGDAKAAKSSDAAPKVNGVEKKATDKGKASGDIKNVGGVTVDDRKKGSGPAAKKGDRVSLRYIGKLEKDKRVFDSNKKGKPFTFKLGASEVIKGWDLGVVGMAAGGERRITIPPHLAYGNKDLPDIPANSTLVFDLKLLEVK